MRDINNKTFFIKNPQLFQGEKNLENINNYFEGWYFKNIENNNGISFIPGISIKDGYKHAFIQVLTKDFSKYISYDFKDFKYNHSPFYIKIGNSVFSREKILLDIKDEENNISGELKYIDREEINRSIWSPNIMGPFSYIPFMECNHAIISMKHKIEGKILINGKELSFANGIGYIEKDWGTSFPKSYLWCQANNFENSNSSMFFSVADIPFKMINFRGHICVFKLDDKEYRFTTYNNSRIEKLEINDDCVNIRLKKGIYTLEIECTNIDGLDLIAPIQGEMKRGVKETIDSVINVTFKENNKVIFCKKSNNGGLEITKNWEE